MLYMHNSTHFSKCICNLGNNTTEICNLLQSKCQLFMCKPLTYWSQSTGGEGIALISLIAGAGGYVVDDLALGIDAAQTRARVHALQVLAGLVRGTVGIDCAFGSACNIWVAKIVGNALACCCSIPIRAYCILSTGCGVAWVLSSS